MYSQIDGIIWEADADTLRFSRVEGSVDEILGYSAQDWLNQPDFWQDRIHPDDAEWVVESCLDASRKRLPHRLTYRMVAADGRTVWLQDNVKVKVEGKRATLTGIMIDVTELVENRRQLAVLNAQNAHFHELYGLVPVAIWEENWAGALEVLRSLKAQGVHDIHAYADRNPDFVGTTLARLEVLSVNQAAVDMFRAESAQELIRRSHEVFQAEHPSSIFLTALDAILRGERRMEGKNTLRRLDGEKLHVMYRIALPDIDDNDSRVVICEMDISAEYVANERFELVTRATSDVIWDFDIVNDTLWASDGLMRNFGLDPAAMFDSLENWTARIHPEDIGRIMQHFDEILHSGRNDWEQEYRWRRGDEKYVIVRDEGYIQRDTDGRAIRMVGSLVDITAERQLEQQLAQSQKLEAIGKLTGGIAHDFNNLLTIVLGNLDFLEEQVRNDAVARNHVASALHAADRSAELVNQLLSYARQQPMAPRAIDMARQLADTMRMIERALGESVEVVLNSDTDLWRLHVDPTQFDNALLNLCINARDAMPDGGRLAIGLRNTVVDASDPLATEKGVKPGCYVCLSVADTGHGMDAETLQAAFDPFFSTKEVGSGSGLGLSMVHGFARQSDGLATIHSSPGKGTVVELLLPALVDETQGEPSGEKKAAGPQPGTGRILLVEDQQLVREHFVAVLETLGYAVVTAKSAAEATEILKGDLSLDLLMSDIVLPGGVTGLMLAQTARELRPGLPIRFTSGFSDTGFTGGEQLVDGKNLLRKPFRKHELAAFVHEAIRPE
ncbi:MAG: PAS domain-containing protein [Pararhodobacter sp.]|nr:PAS domain-containing protein [Pararhodobacter sp.]